MRLCLIFTDPVELGSSHNVHLFAFFVVIMLSIYNEVDIQLVKIHEASDFE